MFNAKTWFRSSILPYLTVIKDRMNPRYVEATFTATTNQTTFRVTTVDVLAISKVVVFLNGLRQPRDIVSAINISGTGYTDIIITGQSSSTEVIIEIEGN